MRHASTTIPVDSSWIRSVTYASDATLIVRVRSGTVYRYFTVPRSILEEFLTAPSKGAHFTHRIRNAFPYTQLRRGSDSLLIGRVSVRTRIRP